ncbi:EAL domain-containing protein [Undibacterium sp. Jales W-56]|uniref:bifunctional diguanylate cyclase/phosphodiesterase n=1 Tax=Undibacterium sp. Jales W-56 TaxID=2897325 RepID=UPI0021D2AA90|nr:EAL domain-containing protein [Undibacterium sp. Jales W-56]MCU6433985.1 EAL domain-containing protein [Undibacterium sp. Jales W-56]
MQPTKFTSLLSKWSTEFLLLKKSYSFIFVWPMISLILISIIWALTNSQISQDSKQLHTDALKDVASLSRAYSQYLNRTFEQIDQISMHVKYDWENSNKSFSLEKLRSQGLFTASQFALVAILDKSGRPNTSTIPMEKWQDTTLRGQFYYHKNNNSSAMQISLPAVINSSGKPVIHFTRRLDNRDESFAGIVVISISPDYFSSFYDFQSLGSNGLLAILGTDGKIGASRIGNKIPFGLAQAVNQELSFKTFEGSQFFENKEMFNDQEARFLGWQKLGSYPFYAVVGLSETELMKSHFDIFRKHRISAIEGSVFLLLFGLVSTTMAIRLAWRKHEASGVSDTYRLATEGTDEGFYILNAIRDVRGKIIDFQFADCNARGANFFGLNREELIGVNMSSLQGEGYFNTLLEIYSKAMETGFYEDEYELSDASPMKMAWARRRLARSGSGLAVTIKDISAKKEAEKKLSLLVNQDSLTGLYNRNWFLSYLPKAIQRAKSKQSMMALLFIDLDGFKNVNDTQGHAAGDHLLKSVASRLQSVVRPSDNVVRLGGDEFVVALEPVERENKPARVAERIAEAFQQPFWWDGQKHLVGASIGISLYPNDGEDTETLLKNADIAMYSVKATGKGNYNFYKPELYTKIKARFEMEQAFVQSLELDHFVLHYQPRVNAISGELTSMEALVRWMHPTRGMVSPVEFIPIAEETGLILKLGEMVMDKACAQIAQWKSQNLPPIPVSINVSAKQFHAGGLQKRLVHYLEKYNLSANLLEVEITESAMMGEDKNIMSELVAIRSLGIQLLVDDFGTGYSSLSQLQRLDMDVLKIDRVFTSELTQSSEGGIFFKAIVSMAHALNMTVVAEGVETREQLHTLRELSCDELQGYLISRPLPAELIPELIQKKFLI